MKLSPVCLAAAFTLLLNGCINDHLIPDNGYRNQVRRDYESKKSLAASRDSQLFSIFNTSISVAEYEAMQFLFAYMPLSDLADYTGDFFLTNARLAIRTRNETEWGNEIPYEVFLHYVLPPRVNNENLDSFRIVYYNEISERIHGLNAGSAALEINHWCHEKVEYQPADIRTSAPMATVLSARGRCGEESTFTVAALRTAGLPARQVYTPRWAHSDDNHAWVEVWIDNSWHYMGACEPEPVLDRGWFTEPARRAMLVHTRSFGAPADNESWIIRTKNYSLVNNLSLYANTKTIYVKVLDNNNRPVSNADVEYQLYNYAEFYPLAVIPTDETGMSMFETGLGDLLIWASRGDNFGFEKITVAERDTVILRLDRMPSGEFSIEYDLGVPPVLPPFPGIPDSLAELNNIRLSRENAIREHYRNTWMQPGESSVLAIRTGYDTTKVQDIIRRSMGNYASVAGFLSDVPAGLKDMALRMLLEVADKDLRDTREYILMDHLVNTIPYNEESSVYSLDIYVSYVLNPRIDNEILSDWRKYLADRLPEDIRSGAMARPEMLVSYVGNEIKIDDTDNYYGTPLTPVGVSQLKLADAQSRDIYFIAVCRSIGIPARMEPGTNLPQYFFDGVWHDVYFSGSMQEIPEKGYISLISNDKLPEPEYYIHFTIAKFDKGRYNTLQYDYNTKISGFPPEIALEPGHYMLVTGNRLTDSSILSGLRFFDLMPGDHRIIEVSIRKENSTALNLGKLDLNTAFKLRDGTVKKLTDICAKGLVISWLEPGTEPARHILNDLPLLADDLDEWGGYFIFVNTEGSNDSSFDKNNFEGLPLNSIFIDDPQSVLLRQCYYSLSCSSSQFPLIILTDNTGNIMYKSEGYRVGIGEQLLKNIVKN